VPKPENMYETGHAFTYLLLKENVANDVVNVSLFAYDKITLKTYKKASIRSQHSAPPISGYWPTSEPKAGQ